MAVKAQTVALAVQVVIRTHVQTAALAVQAVIQIHAQTVALAVQAVIQIHVQTVALAVQAVQTHAQMASHFGNDFEKNKKKDNKKIIFLFTYSNSFTTLSKL
ncbi:MAG: hypothetical protein LBU60_00105 [Clostridiales bacterium]|nr:hypothetical protein [Clostridiales bacterium]